jgi:hypothetical protein
MYRRKDDDVSFRLKTYLLVRSEVSFSSGRYLKDLECRLTLPSGEKLAMKVEWTVDTVTEFRLDTMLHGFRAYRKASLPRMRNTVATLGIDYHLSFIGRPSDQSGHFELIVPLVVMTHRYKGR